MSLTLEIVSRQRKALGAKSTMTFGQDGGTIGRSLETDWSLPDSQRFLSSRHASIDFRSGSYYIVDTSKNGVYINDAEQPVGRGKPQRLFPGDRIRIGEYEMVVSIANVDDTRESLLNLSHVDPVDLKQRVEAPEPTGADLVDAYVITGVGIEMFLEDEEVESLKPLDEKFQSDAAGGESSSQRRVDLSLVPDPPEVKPAKAAIAPAPARPPTSDSVPRRTARDTGGAKPLAAFFRGAGIDAPKLDAAQSEQLMLRLGQMTREFLVGMIDCLHVRALQKAQLKQSNTTIQARDNNRLKFSANFEEGFTRLFLDESEEYMGPVDSVRGAFADIKQHQRALLTATRQALDEYLDRIEPEVLEQRASNGRSGSLINAANKLRYWDLYKDVYAILANRPPNELPQPFLDALANAYQQATARPTKSAADDASREAG